MPNDQIRVREVKTLADDWAVLKKTTLDYQRHDGTWQTLTRETYDRGNGATILLYNRERGTVILTRQFRYPVYVNGHADGHLIETPAGLLDQRDAAETIRRETQEETGYQVQNARQVLQIYMSPGSVTEKLYFFVAEYSQPPGDTHGGLLEDGEDIHIMEVPFTDALAMIDRGEIADAKTIILLQWAALHGLLG